MSAQSASPDQASLDRAAADWLIEREDGFTPERANAFAAWLHADPRHAATFRQAEQTFALLDEAPALPRPISQPVAEPPPAPSLQRQPARTWAWVGGMAAALAIGFTVWQVSLQVNVTRQEFTADQSAQRCFALEDGSVIDLNRGGRLTVEFSRGERRVTLEQGEAHFKVAPDKSRPFTVTANGVAARAVGTSFGVRVTPTGADVLVTEGKVEVGASTAGRLAPSASAPPLLHAGERTQLAPAALTPPRIEAVTSAAIEQSLLWRNDLTNFANVPLREIVQRFNLRNATQLVLATPELGDRRIGGMIALDQLDAFVRLLTREDAGLTADREPGRIVLRRSS